MNEDSPYWSIDVPGLDRESALELVRLIVEQNAKLAPIPVDPHFFMTLHLDRESVEVLRDSLRRDQLDHVGVSLLEALEEWLEWPGSA
ncbi:hypothetical protein [Nonomuraea solani]|uniref:hypothetical protein n=1 Tax=Nonomuraea solani TaxID=1144553 RepID=UPI0011B0A910|nr:hypothetical protein [Nonomuraea solani]